MQLKKGGDRPELGGAHLADSRPSGKEGQTLKEVEHAHIERVLHETQHNLSHAARILGIDRSTLYSKLRRYGLR